jgi:hypothetical protein
MGGIKLVERISRYSIGTTGTKRRRVVGSGVPPKWSPKLKKKKLGGRGKGGGGTVIDKYDDAA